MPDLIGRGIEPGGVPAADATVPRIERKPLDVVACFVPDAEPPSGER